MLKNGLIILTLLLFSCSQNSSKSDEKLLKKAKSIHSRIVTIDTHTDTPLMLLRDGFDFSGENLSSRGKVDLKKMETGGLDAAFFAVFIGQGERKPEKYAEAYERAINIFKLVYDVVQENSDRCAIGLSSDDAKRLKNENKRAIYIGVENGYPIGMDLNILEEFFNLGARYLTLCHTRNNDICDSSTDPNGPEHNGLSPFGTQVVEELNRLGMMIDVSHISDKAFHQVINLSKTPVIASHSSVRAICDNPRNLSDKMLRSLANNGGVIQICLLSSYLKKPEPFPKRDSARIAIRAKYNNFQDLTPEIRQKAVEEWYAIDDVYPPKLATVSDLVDHIDYVVKTIGVDYVGIGSDFDGGGAIKGCFDASQMHNITLELLRRGYKEKDIEKIWGGNFLRVFREVELHAQNLKQD